MREIKVTVDWFKNYGIVYDLCNCLIVVTHNDFNKLKSEFWKSFKLTFNEICPDFNDADSYQYKCIKQDIDNNNIKIIYELNGNALLQYYRDVFKTSIISKICNLNRSLITQYKLGIKYPHYNNDKLKEGFKILKSKLEYID